MCIWILTSPQLAGASAAARFELTPGTLLAYRATAAGAEGAVLSAVASDWLPLHQLDGGWIGLLSPGSGLLHDPGTRALAPYDPANPFILMAEGAAREHLDGADLLVADVAVGLYRLAPGASIPEEGFGCRTQRLRTPEQAMARIKAAPPRDEGYEAHSRAARFSREQGPEFWTSLSAAVNTERYLDDLDYLSTTLVTRYAPTSQMDQACAFVYDAFDALGLEASYFPFTWNGYSLRNVLGVKTGAVYPDRIHVIVGHLDSISPDPWNVAPGADDNASGSSAVLEAARLLAALESEETIYFLCVSAEEQGLIGSARFATWAAGEGLDIRSVLNLDMVAYHDPAGDDLWLEGFRQGVPSTWLMDLVQENAETWAGLSVYQYGGEGFGSDHVPFHNQGYPAILSIENEWASYPCYHRTCDTVDQTTPWLWGRITAANVITLAQLARVSGGLGAIAGRVTLEGSEDASGVALTIAGTEYPERISDSGGAFAWQGIFPGQVPVRAEKQGYFPVTIWIDVPSGGLVECEITLEPLQPGTIRGTVRLQGGAPVEGARIEVEGHDGFAVSGADGRYEFAPAWPGSLNLSAAAFDLMPRGASLSLGQGETMEGVDITLSAAWDFESSSEGFIAGDGWAWGTDAVSGAHSGTKVWGTVLGGNYANCADYRLDLPPISLVQHQSASLHLWSWHRTQAQRDGGNLQASIDGGASWTIVQPVLGYNGTLGGACNPLDAQPGLTGAPATWTERSFLLDPFRGHWLRLRFQFGSDSSTRDRGWYLDDFSFAGTLAPVDVAQSESVAARGLTLEVFPNPATAGTALRLELPSARSGSLAVYDAAGRRVALVLARGRIEAGAHEIPWDARDDAGRRVPSGIYWVRWEDTTGATARAVVVLR